MRQKQNRERATDSPGTAGYDVSRSKKGMAKYRHRRQREAKRTEEAVTEVK